MTKVSNEVTGANSVRAASVANSDALGRPNRAGPRSAKIRTTKTLLIALLLLPPLTHAEDTNNPARLRAYETWASASRLERIAKNLVKQQKIEFSFEKKHRDVWVEKRGTDSVATISFSSGIGKPVLIVEVAPSGKVITNIIGLAVCGTGEKR